MFSAQIGVLFVCVFGLTVLSITIDYYHSEISLSLSLSVALYISPKAKRENAAMASVIGCMYLLWLESNSSLLTNQWRTCLCILRLIENEWVETTKYQIVSRITISATTGTGTRTGFSNSGYGLKNWNKHIKIPVQKNWNQVTQNTVSTRFNWNIPELYCSKRTGMEWPFFVHVIILNF